MRPQSQDVDGEDQGLDADEDPLMSEELKKVKVLKIIEEKMRVSGNEYLKA